MKANVNPAYERADADRKQVEKASREHRGKVRDHEQCWEHIERAAPFVPSWEFPL
jgi:hypothetical protein